MGINDEGTSLVFMDMDYLLFDIPGGGNFLLEPNFGFVSAEEKREPVLGSIKTKL